MVEMTAEARRESPPHGGVDRNLLGDRDSDGVERRPLTGAWIET